MPSGVTDGYVVTADSSEPSGVVWAAQTGGSTPNAEDIPFTPAGTIAATDVQAAIEEVAAEATGGSGAVSVVTSIPGGTPTDGDTILLRAGSSPYDFVLLTYDATYAKWVSQPIFANTKIAAGTTETSTSYVGVATSSQLRYPNGWKPLSTAGLAPQFRLIAQIQNSAGGNTTFCSLLTLTADSGAAFATAGAAFAEVSNVGVTAALKDSGWVAIPGGITVTDFITPNIQVKVSAGTGTLFACSVQIRWVA